MKSYAAARQEVSNMILQAEQRIRLLTNHSIQGAMMPAKKLKDIPDSPELGVKDFRSLFEQLLSLPEADPEKERLDERKRLLRKLHILGLSLVDESDLVYNPEIFFEVKE